MYGYISTSPLDKAISRYVLELTGGLRDDLLSEYDEVITFNDFLTDRMLVIQAVQAGLPYSIFELIQEQTPLTDSDWIEALGISSKSLQRYRAASDHIFKPIHSEKIIAMAEVSQLGVEVLGSLEKFELWLQTPSYALGNMKPRDLLMNSYGVDLVMTELTHIDHGIFV